MPLSPKQLELARTIFTSESDLDIRDLAFIEAYNVIGNVPHTKSLGWESVRVEERAIVFEHTKRDYRATPVTEWVVEVARYPLNDEAIKALTKLSDRVQSIVDNKGIEYPSFVFPCISNGYSHFYIMHGDGQRRKDTLWHMAHYENQSINKRINNHVVEQSLKHRETFIEENPLAQQLRDKIERTKAKLLSLESQLDHVVKFGKMPKTSKDGKPNDGIEVLDLSVRVYNSLKRSGITHTADLLEMLQRGPDSLFAIRNFGERSVDEVVSRLHEKGYISGML